MVSLEFSLLVVSVIVSLILVSFAGSFYSARGNVLDATAEAARAASLKQDPAEANRAAAESVEVSLRDICNEVKVETNTRDFKPGGIVEVEVDCRLSLLGLSLFSLPGEIGISANAREVIDRYRAESRL